MCSLTPPRSLAFALTGGGMEFWVGGGEGGPLGQEEQGVTQGGGGGCRGEEGGPLEHEEQGGDRQAGQ